MTTYLLLEIQHKGPIDNITDLVGGRVYSLDSVRDCTASIISKSSAWVALDHARGMS